MVKDLNRFLSLQRLLYLLSAVPKTPVSAVSRQPDVHCAQAGGGAAGNSGRVGQMEIVPKLCSGTLRPLDQATPLARVRPASRRPWGRSTLIASQPASFMAISVSLTCATSSSIAPCCLQELVAEHAVENVAVVICKLIRLVILSLVPRLAGFPRVNA